MKILMLTTKYSRGASSPWLTNELAEELKFNGYEITVLCIDWKSESTPGASSIEGISLINFPPSYFINEYLPQSIRKTFKWILSSIFAYNYFSRFTNLKEFDILICFSPCFPFWFCILKLRFIVAKRIIIYWDFFPIHQFEIGKFQTRWLLKPAFFIEKFLLSTFSNVGCMSPKNIIFFKNYFLLKNKVKVFEMPIWGKKYPILKTLVTNPSLIRNAYPYETLIVFGGQLEKGRGIDTLILIAEQLKSRNQNIGIVIAGEGPLGNIVLNASKDGLHNLIYLGSIPRDEYLQFIHTCDLGVITTQMDVSVPTYPSKCIDYLLSSLPIIAFVEKSTDFGSIIQDAGCGVFFQSNNVNDLTDKLIALANDDIQLDKMRLSCLSFFERRHNVSIVAKNLINEF
jgi:glycosyltransferase involved in cell wall biosynthesis